MEGISYYYCYLTVTSIKPYIFNFDTKRDFTLKKKYIIKFIFEIKIHDMKFNNNVCIT